jgi:hypothetical protein
MRHARGRKALYRILKWSDVGVGFAIPVVYGAVRWTREAMPLPRQLEQLVLSIQQHGLLLLFLLPVAAYATRLRKYLRSPVTWQLVHKLLTELQKSVYKDQEDGKYNHRVTLFVKVKGFQKGWPPQWRSYLVPAERSGAHDRTSSTRFLCEPEKQGHKHEGVAGQTWVQEKVIAVGNLPDLYAEMDETTLEAAIQDYAKKTWVPVEWVRQRVAAKCTMARSFVGIPVEISGRMAGVVILDSRNPRLPTRSKYQSAYDLVAKLLSEVLEKGVNLDQ